MNPNILKILGLMEGLTMDELRDLNHLVVGLINQKRSQLAILKAGNFNVGDTVSFQGRRKKHKVGKIIKCNPRKAIVSVKNTFAPVNGVKYSVPYEMLTKVPKV